MSSRRFHATWLLLALASGACGTPSSSDAPDGAGGSSTGGQDGNGTDVGSGGATGGSETDGSGGTDGASGGSTSGTGGSDAGSGGSEPSTGGESSTGGTGATGGSAPLEDPVPSAGCDSAAPASGLRTIDVDGTEREYILTLPSDYDSSHPYRLVFGFHGAQYDAEWVANGEDPLTGPYFGIQEESQGSTIFVAGQALPGSWSNTDGRDLAYVETLLSSLESELCIDESRVFATGFSMGGIMTVRIGCALGDVFRAIAPMSPSLPSDCEDSAEPIAYWTSHGLSDTTITPEQGAVARAEFLERNGCSETTTTASPEGCVSYEGCSAGNPVGFCTFEGAHVPAPFAGVAIWSFFEQF